MNSHSENVKLELRLQHIFLGMQFNPKREEVHLGKKHWMLLGDMISEIRLA